MACLTLITLPRRIVNRPENSNYMASSTIVDKCYLAHGLDMVNLLLHTQKEKSGVDRDANKSTEEIKHRT